MKIQEIAELLSAFAAFVTVGLAAVELSARSKAKKADVAINIYSNFLFVNQQLSYAVENVLVLAQRGKDMPDSDRKAYAKTHIIDKALLNTLQHIENEFINNSNCNTDEGKRTSAKVLDFTGKAANLILTINTFYTMLIDDEESTIERIQKDSAIIERMYAQLKESTREVEGLLRNSLKILRNNSNIYIIVLGVLTFLFIFACFLLG